VYATTEVVVVEPGEGWTTMRLALPDELAPYVAEKGAVALDGVSLTVAGVDDGTFTVGLIPHTLEHTTLGQAGVGTQVNVEADVVAKYVERLLAIRRD
jgi:riboflavin synthase